MKSRNKIFWSLLLSATVLMAMGIGTASASYLVTTLNEGFEVAPDFPDITLGDGTSPGEPWGFGNKASITYHAAGYTTNGTQVLKMDQTIKTGSNYGPYLAADRNAGNTGPDSGIWDLDLDVALDDGSQHSKFYFRSTDGPTLFSMWFEAGEINIDLTEEVITPVAGAWNHLTLEIDLDADLLDVYVNDPAKTGAPAVSDYAIVDARWDCIGTQTYVTDPGVTYVDNMVITPEPASLAFLLLGLLPMLRRRR